MAVTPRPAAPRRAPRQATAAERAATLRNINRAEARMLPPGWDAGLEHQFGAALPTEPPRPERPQIEQHHLHRAVPTLTVVHNADKAECGHGVCPLSPSCTRRCYLTEAHRSLRQSIAEREAQLAEPPEVEIDRRLRRRVAIGLALYALAFVSLAAWLFV
jgi:hypothetical protein